MRQDFIGLEHQCTHSHKNCRYLHKYYIIIFLYFSWWHNRNFRVPSRSTTKKLPTAGNAFRYWNKKDNTFQFKLPPGTCKAEISFMGVSGIHEIYFSKNTSEASHVSQEDYDYEYKSEAYMLDREFTKHGRHPPIVERPIPRVENMTEFYNPTQPSHFINGSLVRKRRVYASHELSPARRVGGTMGMSQGPVYFTRIRSSPVRRPRSYSRSPSKTPERRRSYSKSPSGSPVRCPSIRSTLDQDLLLIPEVGLDLHPIVDPPSGMKPIFLHGKGNLHKSLGI